MMTSFTFLVPDEIAARFDRIADGEGGRSALLRRLVAAAAEGQGGNAPSLSPRTGRADQRVELLFTSDELAAIEAFAAERGMRRSGWLTSLIRHRLNTAAEPAAPEAKTLESIRSELRRIGVNLNQIAHACHSEHAAVRDIDRIEMMVAEIRELVAAVGAARRGDLSYWQVAS